MSTVHAEAQGLAGGWCSPNKYLVNEQVSKCATFKVTSVKFPSGKKGGSCENEGQPREAQEVLAQV